MDYLAVGALFKQENDWLEEWVRYHNAIGVERFYLYCHDDKPCVAKRILTSKKIGQIGTPCRSP